MKNNNEIKKLNNKGFSLVELIIVIAIMAVLIGVLAPQYLKYVEKSRISSDKDNVSAVVSALTVYGADPDATLAFADGDKITLGRSSSAYTVDANGAAAQALASANITLPTLTNKQTFDTVEISIAVNATTHAITVTTVYKNGATVVTP